MYYPIGWPKYLHIPQENRKEIRHITCNRDRILYAVVTDDSIGIWFCKPCVQIVNHRRSQQSIATLGTNLFAEWKMDSSMIAIVTSMNSIVFCHLDVDSSKHKSLYEQIDSRVSSLQRETAELFIKEPILPLSFTESFSISVGKMIMSLASIRDELMLATRDGLIEKFRWDGSLNLDYTLNLSRIPFSVDQQHSRAFPIEEPNVCVIDIEYSPILGGFAVVFSDHRAGFLTATTLKFDPNQVQGIWAQDLQDATCTSVNHKYRLIAFGRKNAHVVVYNIDELSGALQISQRLELSSKDFPDACSAAGSVSLMKWTPDGCVLAVCWEKGGISLWSVFGALLMCSLGWDLGINHEIFRSKFYQISTMEWGAEGYQLWLGVNSLLHPSKNDQYCSSNMNNGHSNLMQMNFVKSALTVNPCMSNQERIFLQGEDRLYINAGDAVVKMLWNQPHVSSDFDNDIAFGEIGMFVQSSSSVVGNKQWIVVPIPYTYTGNSWPVRYTAIHQDGQSIAIAGRTGIAHYSLPNRKWKLFGNETQEKDFVVTGGLMWWQDFIVMGCYNILDDKDEIRLYPRDTKLDNAFMQAIRVPYQVLMTNLLRNKLIIFCANSHIFLYSLTRKETPLSVAVQISCLQEIDISSFCIHPACVVSIALTSLRSENVRNFSKDVESILINICGKLIMIQRDASQNGDETDNNHLSRFSNPTMLASCVENVWVSSGSSKEKQHLLESLWLGCGAHGLKVWLPLLPRDTDKPHNFMSRRIMLPFHMDIYPLAVLFEDAVILGAENDTILYPNDFNNLLPLMPFCIVERTTQVYLHHIIRQLLKRNLGYHAWEIARSCSSLPYFSHSLELLLHEVLEEEATSKEPIPDALLPRVIEFIREFPVYLQTVVQCARKTEIALWPYLFTAVGNPRDLFQECLDNNKLETAASYLIILQNVEASSTSRQYATLLLDTALDNCKWELAKDLIRFLKAIDPSDVESPPRSSICLPSSCVVPHQTSPVSTADDDLSLVLGTMQVLRSRTLSITSLAKPSSSDSSSLQKEPSKSNESKLVSLRKRSDGKESTAEEFFIDVILIRHTRKLLSSSRLRDLGSFAAHLDIHLVSWLKRERNRAGRIDNFVSVLKKIHHDFQWPYPVPLTSGNLIMQRTASISSSVPSGTGSSSPLEEKMKSLSVDILNKFNPEYLAQKGDSGYLSNTGFENRNVLLQMYEPLGNDPMEARLQPHIINDSSSHHTIEMSECSSVWGEGEHPFLDENTWNNIQLTADLELISMELANKGPQQCEVQLRYLLQLMMEAGCLDYSLVISIILRDAMAVIRTINASRVPDHPVEVPIRLRDGLMVIDQWAEKECLGYKPFLQAVRNQVTVLNKIIWSKPKSRHSSNSDQSCTNERFSVSEEPHMNNSLPTATSVMRDNVSNDPSELERTRSESSSNNTPPPFEDENKGLPLHPSHQVQHSGSDCTIS